MTHETEPRDQGAVLRRGDALSERKMMEYPGDTCFKDTPRARRCGAFSLFVLCFHYSRHSFNLFVFSQTWIPSLW